MKKILFFTISLTITCLLQAADTSGPKTAILKYFEASKIYDTTLMANMMHPEALHKFRKSITTALNGNQSELAKKELLPLFNTSSMSSYLSLSDREAFKRLNDVIASSQPDLIDLMKIAKFEIVSEVMRNELVYVTYTLSLSIDGRNTTKDIVQKLKKSKEQWLLLLPADGDATIAGIESRYK